MTSKNPFEIMMEQAQEMAKTMTSGLSSFDVKDWEKLWPTMPKDTMEAFFGKAARPDGLDAKTRLLITLAGLTMQGAQAETPFRLCVRHAKEAGATPGEIAETIAQIGAFSGLPAMTRAMELAQAVLDEDEEQDP